MHQVLVHIILMYNNNWISSEIYLSLFLSVIKITMFVSMKHDIHLVVYHYCPVCYGYELSVIIDLLSLVYPCQSQVRVQNRLIFAA